MQAIGVAIAKRLRDGTGSALSVAADLSEKED